MRLIFLLGLVACLVAPAFGVGPSGVTFRRIHSPSIDAFSRLPIEELLAIREALIDESISVPIPAIGNPPSSPPGLPPFMGDMSRFPQQETGLPGVVVADFNNDGKDDVLVTQGAGAPHHLLMNEGVNPATGDPIFRLGNMGVDTSSQEGSGACAGDVNGDGCTDLLVLSFIGEQHMLLLGNCDGTFRDGSDGIVLDTGFAGKSSIACAMGNINSKKNKALDIVVVNAYDPHSLFDCMYNPQGGSLNRYLENNGDGTFVDRSVASGFANWAGGISWAVGLANFGNGCLSAVVADDQCLFPFDGNSAGIPGFTRGLMRMYTGHCDGTFEDVTDSRVSANPKMDTVMPGPWMSVGIADLNSDGLLDLFGTNMGAYTSKIAPWEMTVSSRTILQFPNGSFICPEQNPLGGTPFGWGAVIFDPSNNGYYSIVYNGGLAAGFFFDVSNAMAFLVTKGIDPATGYPIYERDADAFDGNVHQLREGHGFATGDFNGDGFPDVVDASNYNLLPGTPIIEMPPGGLGSPFDHNPDGSMVPGMMYFNAAGDMVPPNECSPFTPCTGSYIRYPEEHGDIALMMNNAETKGTNNFISVRVHGTADVIDESSIGWEGIGANIRVFPIGSVRSEMIAVMAGSSHSSQDSFEKLFGLGTNTKANILLEWPTENGPIYNYWTKAEAGDKLDLHELPCNIKGTGSKSEFSMCLATSLTTLLAAGKIDGSEFGGYMSANNVGWNTYHQ